MSVEVHDRFLRKRYYADRLSCAYCSWAVSCVVLVVAPLLLAFGSYGFWLKEKMYHEQPEVTFRNEMVVVLEGTSSGEPFQAMWTTSAAANDLVGAALRAPFVKSRSIDDNRDGFADSVDITVSMPLQSGESINRFQMVALFDYKLHNQGKLIMDAAALIEASNSVAGSGATIVGDIELHQRQAMLVKGGYLAPYADSPLFDGAAAKSFSDISVEGIMSRAVARNFSASFSAPLALWHSDLGGAATEFKADVTVRVPSALAYATPAASEIFKQGWIQYVGMLTFVWYLVREFRDFLFQQRLISARVVSDAVGAKAMH